MDVDWRQLHPTDIYFEPLVAILTEAREPVSLSRLVRIAVTQWLKGRLQPLTYNPQQKNYQPGDFLRLPDGQIGRVDQVIKQHNPVQGEFQLLIFADPDQPRLVSGVRGSRQSASTARPARTLAYSEIETMARSMLQGEAGQHLRPVVCEALEADTRLVSFNDEWWLVEKLPWTVKAEDLVVVRNHLESRGLGTGFDPVRPAELVQLLWSVPAGDRKQMRLAEFSLNCALARQPDFRFLRPGGWVLAGQLPHRTVRRQPQVPHVPSTVLSKKEPGETGRRKKQESARSLEPSEVVPQGFIESFTLRLEAKVRLLGQHYLEGFLPLEKNGLGRVIPPSQNELELAWLIYRRPDNTEGRIKAVVDYDEEVVSGGPLLHDYLASEGILPGCYLYVRRRNEVEYDIYPKLLSQPATVACKFAEIDERGRLVIEQESVQVQYEHDSDYIISETRLENMAALWAEAEKLHLSFFDILVKHIFPKLAPNGEAVHWKRLWAATFYGYRMGSQAAIRHELGRECFVPEGGGRYRFDPDRSFGFPEETSRPSQAVKPLFEQSDGEPSAENKTRINPAQGLPTRETTSATQQIVGGLPAAEVEHAAGNQLSGPQQHYQVSIAPALPRQVNSAGNRPESAQPPRVPFMKSSRSSPKGNFITYAILGGVLGMLAGVILGTVLGVLFGFFAGALVTAPLLGFIGLIAGACGGMLIGLVQGAGS